MLGLGRTEKDENNVLERASGLLNNICVAGCLKPSELQLSLVVAVPLPKDPEDLRKIRQQNVCVTKIDCLILKSLLSLSFQCACSAISYQTDIFWLLV